MTGLDCKYRLTRRTLTLSGLVMALMVGPALAHHSFAMFDRDKTITLTGTIKEFQWTNPHCWIQVMVTDRTGKAVEWSIEAQSTGTLSRMGWKPRIFKPGEKVTLKVYPMKDGSPGGAFIGAILANGEKLGEMES